MPFTERELANWRREIVDYRLQISDDVAPEIARAYWALVDVLEACIKLSGADFEEQMELIDRQIEDRLRRRRGGTVGERMRQLRALNPPPGQIKKKSAATRSIPGTKSAGK